MKIKKVVYSCLTGGYDDVPVYKYIAPGWDYILFTDDADLIKSGSFAHWTVRPLQFNKLTNVKNARWHKINAHKLFPDYDYSLWLDSNICINDSGLFDLVDNLIKNKTLVAVPNHPERLCVYKEAEIIKMHKIDAQNIVDQEIKILQDDNYPRNKGLSETGILLRRHNNIKSALDLWWYMVEKYSKRDQLSFNYALWKNNIERTPIYSGPYGFGIHRLSDTFSFSYNKKHGQQKFRTETNNKFYIPLWLARIICLFVFSHEKRRDFRHKYVKSPEPVNVPSNFKMDIIKYKAFMDDKDTETVVLGSSHARDGFVPDKHSFNLGNSSQDLYRAYKVYEFISKQKSKQHKIKNIVLFWSVFHPGLQLEKTQEYYRCIPYKILYNADYPIQFPIDDKPVLKRLRKDLKKQKYPDGYRGESYYDVLHTDITSELVEKHIKNTRRNNHQIRYVEKMLNIARKYGHKFYIVLPPYRSDYLKCLPPDNEIYFELFDFINANPDVKLLNFQRDKDFDDSDFDSADHCNIDGAKKLTKKINEKLK